MYILKYYFKSKYVKYNRVIEKTFDDYLLLVNFIKDKNLKDYEIYINYKRIKKGVNNGDENKM